jgi:hypothetical protein
MLLPMILLLAQTSADPGAVKARETAYARVAIADAIAADAELLRAIKAKNQAGETDADLMDAKGALVCASRETSDYWQGDEAKCAKTYRPHADAQDPPLGGLSSKRQRGCPPAASSVPPEASRSSRSRKSRRCSSSSKPK